MKKIAPFLIIISGCCAGTMGLFSRYMNSVNLSTVEVVELRAIPTAIVMLCVLLIYDRNLLKIKIKDLWCFAGAAVLGVMLSGLCYFKTIETASLSVAAILLYTAPIFVTLLSAAIFKEKLTVKKIICLIMAFSGCALVSGVLFGGLEILSPKSTALGLCAGLGYAVYTIFLRYAILKGYNTVTIIAYVYFTLTIVNGFITDFGALAGAVNEDGIKFIGIAILFSLVSALLTNILYVTGMQYVENGKASIMCSVEPIMATILGIIVYSEIPSISAFVGMVIVIVALSLLNYEKNGE